MSAANYHSLRRTSPKGQAFIGECVLCGEKNLSMWEAGEPCSNPIGMSQVDTLIEAIEGEK